MNHSPISALTTASAEILTIVLVEDSPQYALLVSEMLREGLSDSVDVRVHSTLDAASHDLGSGAIDCVLLDLGLPDARGVDALAQVRVLAPNVPVVVLSGQEDERVALKAVDQGAQDYLVKRHADSHLLSRAIRHAIQRKETELRWPARRCTIRSPGCPTARCSSTGWRWRWRAPRAARTAWP